MASLHSPNDKEGHHMTTTTNKRGPGRPRKNSTNSSAQTRVRKRDRIRDAATSRTFGVSAIALIGTAALGALGYLGFRKVDADRLKADPNAKPLADEIVDRASAIAGDVKDRAQSIAADVSDRASATVHELGRTAHAVKEDVAARTGFETEESRRRVNDAA